MMKLLALGFIWFVCFWVIAWNCLLMLWECSFMGFISLCETTLFVVLIKELIWFHCWTWMSLLVLIRGRQSLCLNALEWYQIKVWCLNLNLVWWVNWYTISESNYLCWFFDDFKIKVTWAISYHCRVMREVRCYYQLLDY